MTSQGNTYCKHKDDAAPYQTARGWSALSHQIDRTIEHLQSGKSSFDPVSNPAVLALVLYALPLFYFLENIFWSSWDHYPLEIFIWQRPSICVSRIAPSSHCCCILGFLSRRLRTTTWVWLSINWGWSQASWTKAQLQRWMWGSHLCKNPAPELPGYIYPAGLCSDSQPARKSVLSRKGENKGHAEVSDELWSARGPLSYPTLLT